MALNIFFPSVTGLEAQSHAMGQISTNIANISTVGYRTNETMFYTMLGSNPVVKGNQVDSASSHADAHGVGYYDRTNIFKTGNVVSSGGNYDVAINGDENAFFYFKDSYNNDYYSRAGNFSTRTQNNVTYLVNQNGMKVQGFEALEGGGFSSAPSDIIIKYPENIPPTSTTEATITANVPADGVDNAMYGITVYAPTHDGETLNMRFSKVEGEPNTWNLSFTVDGGTVIGSETKVVFNSKGEVETPKNLTVDINWDDGETNHIALDISNMTQLAGGTGTTNVKQDGAPGGSFVRSFIGDGGVVQAAYSNGKTYDISKLTVVGFSSAENLTPINGTLFEANGATGNTYYVQNANLEPQALEQSAANVEEQFGKMIVVQRAYSLNSSSFTTSNEMVQTAINLKS